MCGAGVVGRLHAILGYLLSTSHSVKPFPRLFPSQLKQYTQWLRVLFAGGLLTVAHAAPARLEEPLLENWRFRLGAEKIEVATSAPTNDWELVTVPHTWNARDGADGNGDYVRGEAWYRRDFQLGDAWHGKRIFIEFQGANRSAEVFLNGTRIGLHVGGYARFRFELTDAVRLKGVNTLAVKISNADDGTPPYSADFTFFGGVYRAVRLFATDAVHIDVLDHASDGVYVTQENVSEKRADLRVATLLKNDSPRPEQVVVRTVLSDPAGKQVFSKDESVTLDAGKALRFEQPLTVDSPHLWNGLADPARYTINVSLLVNGKLRDEVSDRIGLRYFSVDANEGLFLNGKRIDAHGVSRHQDRAGKGNAISEADDREDFALIQEMGSTAIRVAHYPQSDLWFDLADEAGMIVWAEIPVVNEVSPSETYTENAKLQLRELIRQHYNRPGILFWGVGNEMREVGEGPGRHQMSGPAANQLIQVLHKLVKEEDPTRLSVYASYHRPEDAKNFHTDVLGYNKYIGWYGAESPQGFATWLDDVHKRFPALRLSISEYGAGGNILHHDEPQHKPAPGGEWHPEEYQSYFHEVHWRAMRERDFIWGKFIWNMFDFGVDERSEGMAPGINDKGLITYDRKTKKDGFFWYKANWSKAPVLHIASKRHAHRTESKAEVKVYSNASTVELWLNGVSQGKVTNDDRLFTWNIRLAEGANKLVARAMHPTGELTDECTWSFRK
jgi:beta-galactosidase